MKTNNFLRSFRDSLVERHCESKRWQALAFFLVLVAVCLDAQAESVEDEITVVGERHEPGKVPSPDYIVYSYSTLNCGNELRRKGKHAEALPHLLEAAKRGFKWAQADVADIYLNGLGGVPVDLEAGIGWLGVAAQSPSNRDIEGFFREAFTTRVRSEHYEHFAAIVSEYRANYGSELHRLDCGMKARKPRALGGRTWNFGKLDMEFRCDFEDERDLCNEPLPNGQHGLTWTCDLPARSCRQLRKRTR